MGHCAPHFPLLTDQLCSTFDPFSGPSCHLTTVMFSGDIADAMISWVLPQYCGPWIQFASCIQFSWPFVAEATQQWADGQGIWWNFHAPTILLHLVLLSFARHLRNLPKEICESSSLISQFTLFNMVVFLAAMLMWLFPEIGYLLLAAFWIKQRMKEVGDYIVKFENLGFCPECFCTAK